jgi:phosphatidylserine decarboxylase
MSVAQDETHERWYPLSSFRHGRRSKHVSGSVSVVFWLEDPSNPAATPEELRATWQRLTEDIESHAGAIIANAPPDEPVGMRMADEDSSLDEPFLSADEEFGDAASIVSEISQDEVLDSDLDNISEVDIKQSSSVKPTKISRRKRRRLRRAKSKKPFHFKTSTAGDVLGVVFLEIESAKDLPKEHNLTKTGFDMDPFVITSFSKKTFRTRVVRHSLNPVFGDRLLFQVHKHEAGYNLKFTIVDRDKFSGNDLVGEAVMNVEELMEIGPHKDPVTGLYKLPRPAVTNASEAPEKRRLLGLRRAKQKPATTPDEDDEEAVDNLAPFDLPLTLTRKDFWQDRHNPSLQVKAKFMPYPALRQQFWRVILKHFDTDESGSISKIELTTMLDSLGATLKDSTVQSFFDRFCPVRSVDIDANAVDGQILTIDQCVICLEDLLKDMTAQGDAITAKPVLSSASSFASQSHIIHPMPKRQSSRDTTRSASPAFSKASSRPPSIKTSDKAPSEDTLAEQDGQDEYLISLTQCPLCQRSNMDRKSAVDIVTHLATCASQDWRKVDHLVMGDFITPSQAQRKWYTKIISKVSYGGYKLGANSANILVQDRITGQVQEERMSVYVRLGIRLLYKGMKSSRMESNRIRRMLKSMSIKQGIKYDSPSSAKDIKPFIAFHQLNMDEVLDPVDSFKSFNEFFYRKLKPGARPCTRPEDPQIAVSPADCRSVVFNTLTSATEIWVKGQQFSIARLFGDAYPEDVARFENGSFGIFRLAPQDYHRFHIPADGQLGEPKTIAGQYYTVNPMAIRSNLDVYGENVRVLVPLDTEAFGRVMIVCIGAMMVGSTVITAKPGPVARTDELGYFKFGGSTILLIFEPGRFVFDQDLLQNSTASLETLLRVGSSIGHPPGVPDAQQEKKDSVTMADKQEASRRIEGSMPLPDTTDSNGVLAALKNPVEAARVAKETLLPKAHHAS